MAKRLIGLATLVLVAGFVSLEANRVPQSATSSPTSLSSRIAQVALGGVVIALSPVGSMAGCGGGGPRPSSATAVPVAAAVVDQGSGDAPLVVAGGSSGGAARVTISDRRLPSDVAVSVRLSRPEVGHLRLVLRHPDGTEVVLHDADGAAAGGLVTTFDTASRPDLRALLAKSPEGVWSLVASSSGADATLESWSLRLVVRD